ncbi:MAG: hypothetical protein ABI835_05710 [Chloroflexota bacterium]
MMDTLFSELEAAMDAEITPRVLDLLVEIAGVSVEQDNKGFAVEILALALQYPMNPETLDAAEGLFSVLETELCPRVIRDACDQAQAMTLDDMVQHVLAHSAE